nr:RNA-directed DNA polymerase, eukaryota [Tanacetum cinerariifolium]
MFDETTKSLVKCSAESILETEDQHLLAYDLNFNVSPRLLISYQAHNLQQDDDNNNAAIETDVVVNTTLASGLGYVDQMGCSYQQYMVEKPVYEVPMLRSREAERSDGYVGWMWVLFEFDSLASKEKFLKHSGIGSWFTELIQATSSFENDERIVWISIEGLPIKAWTPNTFCKIASLWGEYVEWEDMLGFKISKKKTKMISSDGESQEGDVANKADNNKSDVDRVSKSSFMHENDTAHKDVNSRIKDSDEPKFPPGFTPDNTDQEKNVEENIKDTTERVQSLSNKFNDRCLNRGFLSQRSMNSHSQKSKVGGSILDLMDELVTVGQTMSYNMVGLGNKAKRRWIKELCQKHRINFASIQETKAESISFHIIKDLWENQMFDHVVGSSIGCSGGVLCVLDLFPHLSALCLDRHLSDHRPILLRETNYDYGPSLIRFFHSWFAMVGFNSFVETTWKSLNIIEPNGLIQLKKKLQALKIAIKAWSKEANKRRALDTHKLIPKRSPWQDVILAIHSLQSKGEVALKVLYKRLYALEMCKSISVSEKMGHPSLSHSFRRMPRGGVELENYDLLCSKVTDLLLPNISDRWRWSLEGSQEFSVKSFRILIDNTILPKAKVPTRWLRVVPIKVNVHAWRVCLDRLPTRANLSLRGMNIPSIACPLCNSAVESSSHIFFACPLARQVWRNFLIL